MPIYDVGGSQTLPVVCRVVVPVVWLSQRVAGTAD
jgi:hypothetical protein